MPFVNSLKSLGTTGTTRTTETTGTNTLPVGNIGIVNLEQKKKPHNVNIKNYNPKEPKIKSNIKYSGKQSFRRYKTKTEPNLHSKIEINEDDDIVNKIKEAFGLKPNKENTNFTDVITAPTASINGVEQPKEVETKFYESDLRRYKDPEDDYGKLRKHYDGLRKKYLPDSVKEIDVIKMNEIDDISPEDQELLTFQEKPYEVDEELREQVFRYWNMEDEPKKSLLEEFSTPKKESEIKDIEVTSSKKIKSAFRNSLKSKKIHQEYKDF